MSIRIISVTIFLMSLTGMAAAEETQLGGRWILFVGEDEQSRESIASLRQESMTTIKDEYATKDVTPVLDFHCRPGNPDIIARINWARFISSFNTEIGFKVDDGKRTWTKWGVDRSEKITSSRAADDTQMLLDLFSGGGELDVEISPYSSSPVNAKFDLTEFDSAVQALAESCK